MILTDLYSTVIFLFGAYCGWIWRVAYLWIKGRRREEALELAAPLKLREARERSVGP